MSGNEWSSILVVTETTYQPVNGWLQHKGFYSHTWVVLVTDSLSLGVFICTCLANSYVWMLNNE